MCSRSRGMIVWDRHPRSAVQVGTVVEDDPDEPRVLLSYGRNRNGERYALWVGTGRHADATIDRIESGPEGLDYVREFRCESIEHAVATFLNLVNPRVDRTS